MPVEVEFASEFRCVVDRRADQIAILLHGSSPLLTHSYKNPILFPDDVLIAISQVRRGGGAWGLLLLLLLL